MTIQEAQARVDETYTAFRRARTKKTRVEARREWAQAWAEMDALENGRPPDAFSLKGTTMTTSKGDTFTTPYATDQEAAEVLVLTETTSWSSFAKDLVDALAKYGEVSDRQRPWLHKMAMEAEARRNREAQEEKGQDGLQAIVDMLHGAKAHLKFPKVRYQGLRLSVAGSRSRSPGSISVTSDAAQYEDRVWHGRISTEGVFQPSRGCPEDVATKLLALAKDPGGEASAEGQRTGACCFCARELTAEDSVEVGYGPVCASRYGLPHGR